MLLFKKKTASKKEQIKRKERDVIQAKITPESKKWMCTYMCVYVYIYFWSKMEYIFLLLSGLYDFFSLSKHIPQATVHYYLSLWCWLDCPCLVSIWICVQKILDNHFVSLIAHNNPFLFVWFAVNPTYVSFSFFVRMIPCFEVCFLFCLFGFLFFFVVLGNPTKIKGGNNVYWKNWFFFFLYMNKR